MATTISVSGETRKKLQLMKIEEGYSSLDEMIRELMIEHKKNLFHKASETFRARMKEKKLNLKDLVDRIC